MSWTLEALLLELNPGSRTFLHVTGQVTLFLPHFSFLQMGIIIDTQVLGLWALVANKTKQNKTKQKQPTCQCRRQERHRFDSRVKKIPWIREWQPTPVFLPREFQRVGHD